MKKYEVLARMQTEGTYTVWADSEKEAGVRAAMELREHPDDCGWQIVRCVEVVDLKSPPTGAVVQ